MQRFSANPEAEFIESFQYGDVYFTYVNIPKI